MEIYNLLEDIEDIIDKAKVSPIGRKALVEKDVALELISEMRKKLPEEIKDGMMLRQNTNRILEEANRESKYIIEQAQTKAENMIEEAKIAIVAMIDEHEITKQAYEKKVEIIESANERSREIRTGTYEYADGILSNMEVILEEALSVIKENRSELK